MNDKMIEFNGYNGCHSLNSDTDNSICYFAY